MAARLAKQIVKEVFSKCGVAVGRRDRLAELIPADYIQSPYLPRVYRQSVARLFYFKEMLEQIRDIDGEVVECGVSIGHGILYLMLLGELTGRNRKVVGFDSFSGFPQPTKFDRKFDGSFQKDQGDYATPTQMVTRVLEDARISRSLIENNLTLVRGFFDETVPQYDGRIALLHLDCDLYESYRLGLSQLYDKVVRGGLIMFDEYEDTDFPGAKRAVDEFFANKTETIRQYCRYQYTKFYVVKDGV